MVKTFGENQREFIGKYIAPLLLDFDFRPALKGLYSILPASRQNSTEILEDKIIYEVGDLIKNPNQNPQKKENIVRQLLTQYAKETGSDETSPVCRGLMRIFNVKEAA